MRISPLKSALLAVCAGTVFACAAFAAPIGAPIAAVSPAPTPLPQRFQNISSRARVLTNDNVLIAGIIITGSAPKNVILRALGPSLNVNGVPIPGRLANPTLELYISGSSVPIAGNNDWQETQRREIQATGVAPSDSFEAAIVKTLDPGNYTAVMRGANEGTGVGLLEAFDLDAPSGPKLANISTRGFVGTGDDVLIGGVIVGGNSPDGTVRAVVRAIAPSLRAHGVPDALNDPTLQVFDSNGMLLAENDNWRGPQGGEIEDSGLAPTDDREAAAIVVLRSGNYTAIVRGQNQTTGVALIEFYDAPITGLLIDPALPTTR